MEKLEEENQIKIQMSLDSILFNVKYEKKPTSV